MASVKVYLRINKKRPDGTCPIVVRITNDRRSIEKNVGYSVKPNEWDTAESKVKKSHPNSSLINNLIIKRKAEANAIMLEAENKDLNLSRSQIKHKIKNNNKSSFNTISDEYLADLLKMKRYNQHSGEKSRVGHFKNFLENRDISFHQISIPLLKKFIVYLKSDKSLNERSVMNCLIVLRSIFNKAIENGLVETKFYPFGPSKIQIKFVETSKVGLNENEVKLIEKIDLSHNQELLDARNIWLASFYLAGVRISDIIKLKWKDISDGRLTYIMDKNGKVVTFKMPEKVNVIINSYRKNKEWSSYVFPFIKDEFAKDEKVLHSKVRSANSVINKRLKRIATTLSIEKNMSMHISRHTFGQIAGDKIAPQLLQKLYRHTDLKTTIGYQANFIHNDVDDALSDVLDF